MKHKVLLKFAILAVVGVVTASSAPAEEQTVAQQVSILDERLSKVRADVDALQANQQQIQQDIKQIQDQMEELRRAGPSASANDLQALDVRVRELDTAREADKKAILDQLSKELAAISGSRGGGGPAQAAGPTNPNEHIVQKGETLTSIAKTSGVTIADLRKANNLTSDVLKVGQKLVIPSK